MSTKQFYHNLDLVSVGQLLNTRLHNVDMAGETALAATLGVANTGLIIYNTAMDVVKTWDGTKFNALEIAVDGDIRFAGFFDASKPLDDVDQPQPILPVSGYQYIVTVGGTFNAGASGVTLQGIQTLRPGDMVLFSSSTVAYAINRNIDVATETVDGKVFLATEAEVIAGISAHPNNAVTAETLQAKLDGQFFTRQYFATVTLAANTPLTINHNLGLVDRNAFVVNTVRNNSVISLDVDSVSENSITLTSLVALTDVKVTVTGAKASI